MKATVIIKDLPPPAECADPPATLTGGEMKLVRGGRAVVVTVDGGGLGHVDDFGINTAIFEGRIKGTYL
ncbi:MAG TPA: hypothetical protein VF573_10750 [Paraburkholderia sp.]|uniref:hypothetical protein n=1 Tax=Paraburkholderia sp. TaxID=1926495 RepID=UPI002ED1A09A